MLPGWPEKSSQFAAQLLIGGHTHGKWNAPSLQQPHHHHHHHQQFQQSQQQSQLKKKTNEDVDANSGSPLHDFREARANPCPDVEEVRFLLLFNPVACF